MIEMGDLLQSVRRAVEVARSGLLWWGDELWHLVPRHVREALHADPIVIEILLPDPARTSQTVAVHTFRGRRPSQGLELEDWRAALAWVAERRPRWGPLMRVDLVLPACACLIRQREIPAAASNRIGEVLALELERATPFNAQGVRQGWRKLGGQADGGSLLVEHVVAKRHLSDAVLAVARGIKVPIAALDVVGTAAGSRLGVNLLEPAEVPHSLTRRLNGAIAIVAALLVVVTLTAGLVAVQRQEDALARLETDIGAARKEALAAGTRLQEADSAFERIGRHRLRRAQDFRVVAIWEEVTRRLPDTAWLTDMRIESNVLWLDGYARSASELVGIVAQSSMFSGVGLSAPVTRDAAKAGERFQLRMKIEKIEPAQTTGNLKSNG
jgi:general secretion pathway protein L